MMNESMMSQWRKLCEDLSKASDRRSLLFQQMQKSDLQIPAWVHKEIQELEQKEQEVVYAVWCCGQSHIFCEKSLLEKRDLIRELVVLDKFYAPLGGICGYYFQSLEALNTKEGNFLKELDIQDPDVFSIDQLSQSAIDRAWQELLRVGICLPIGGAGDRLDYHRDEEPMPVSLYPFAGSTLLKGIFDDIAGIEHELQRRVKLSRPIPVAMMVSDEKQGYYKIQEYLRQHEYFQRDPATIRIFRQDSVPVFDELGHWMLKPNGSLWTKPGGHGAVWRQGQIDGIWDWFGQLGCSWIALRQINNPLAWSKLKLVSLLGFCLEKSLKMGFLSCPRKVGSAEGMHVQFTQENKHDAKAWVSNIEYVDLQRYGLEDKAVTQEESGSQAYSRYPSNTNIFCIRLEEILTRVQNAQLFPKAVANIKPMYMCIGKEKIQAGRLETMMQNLADYICTPIKKGKEFSLDSGILYAPRAETISVVKKCMDEQEIWGKEETPQGAFVSLQRLYRTLLEQGNIFAKWPYPCPSEGKDIVDLGFMTYLHPILQFALSQELEKAQTRCIEDCWFGEKSLLWLESAKTQLHSLSLQGSLAVLARQPQAVSVEFNDCAIVNQALLNHQSWNVWQNGPLHEELGGLRVRFEGRGSFSAQGVCLRGDREFVVPDACSLRLESKNSKDYVQELIAL